MTKEERKSKKYLKKYRDTVIYKGRIYRILGVNTHDCLLDLVGSNLNHVDNVLCDIKSPPKVSVREELSRLTHDIQELSKQIDDIKSENTCLHYDIKTAMIEVKKQNINTLGHHSGTLSMIITAGGDI